MSAAGDESYSEENFRKKFSNHEIAPCTVNYVLSTLSQSELEVAFQDPLFCRFEDFLILADMKRMSREEFRRKAHQQVKSEFKRDFHEFTKRWTEKVRFYAGLDLHRSSGMEVDHTALECCVSDRLIGGEAHRARTFYAIKYYDRMEPIEEEFQTTGSYLLGRHIEVCHAA